MLKYYVQALVPKTGKYIKVNTDTGVITKKKSPNPYKGIAMMGEGVIKDKDEANIFLWITIGYAMGRQLVHGEKGNTKVRTIKSPPKPRPTSLSKIKKAVEKYPPER